MCANLEKCSSKWIESLSLDEKLVRQIEQVSSKMRSFSSWTSLHLLLVSVRQNCSESQNVGAGLFEQLLLEVLCLFSDFWCWNLWPHLLQENTCLTCSPACILSSLLGTVADTGNLREEVQMSRSGRFELGSGRMSGKRERLQESGRTELPSISTINLDPAPLSCWEWLGTSARIRHSPPPTLTHGGRAEEGGRGDPPSCGAVGNFNWHCLLLTSTRILDITS